MLVLSRLKEEVVCIGDDVRITVIRVENGRVRLGFEAPPGVQITRAELAPLPDAGPMDTPPDRMAA